MNKQAGGALAAIVVVAILLVAGVVGYTYYEKNKNTSDDGATFEDFGVGTSITYEGTGFLSETEVSLKMTMKCVGYDKNAPVMESTVIASMTDFEMVMISYDSVFDTASSTKVRTETMDTIDGTVTVDVYEDENDNVAYVGQADSGKKNLAVYKIVNDNDNSTLSLTKYVLKSSEDYTPEDIGLVIGTFKSSTDSSKTTGLEVVGEYKGTYFLEFTYEIMDGCFAVNSSNLVPIYDRDLGTTTKTIGDVTYEAHGYSIDVGSVTVEGKPSNGAVNVFVSTIDGAATIIMMEDVSYGDSFDDAEVSKYYTNTDL